MATRKFKLALVQMRVDGGEKERNLDRAVRLIAEASENGADVALLPECLDLGWTHSSSLTEAEPIPDGAPCRKLMGAAKDHAIYVCAGLTERAGERIYNAAVFIDLQGALRCRHRKLNELEIGHEYYAQGDRLNVVETELGTFGLMICADGFAKDRVLSRSLCYMGADVILSPCAWAVPADHDHEKEPYGDTWRKAYIPVAKAFAVPIVGVSNVGHITGGPWEGRKCIGCSLVIGSDGEEILQGPYGDDAACILYVDLSPLDRPARGGGWGRFWESRTR